MRLRQLVSAAMIVWVLLLGNGVLLAQDDDRSELAEDTQRASSSPDEQETLGEYPSDERQVGTPLDTVTDLNNSLPKKDSLLVGDLPESYSKFKKHLYDKYGLKLGLSYQSIYQKSTENLTDTDSAWGGWFLVEGAWTAFNRGKDWQGKLVLALDGRHIINPSTNAAPGLFTNDIGSLWPLDGAFFEWDIYPATILWEQWGKKDRFVVRVGQQPALSVLDFFRFGEPRTSFTTTQLVSPIAIIPLGPPGLGIAAKWWPITDAELYGIGIVNDINAPAGEVDWSGLFDEGEVFAGAEVGYNWRRGKDDFDHAHLTLWYGDEVSTAPYPTKAGWGFKLHGSKQWDQLVGFGNYGYNTSEGGGFGFTNSRHAVNAGAAYMKPLGIRGEIALAGSWAEPIDTGLRDQYGLETYWKVLVTPRLWVTPGVQVIFDPTFNLEQDTITIAQIKGRLFF